MIWILIWICKLFQGLALAEVEKEKNICPFEAAATAKNIFFPLQNLSFDFSKIFAQISTSIAASFRVSHGLDLPDDQLPSHLLDDLKMKTLVKNQIK